MHETDCGRFWVDNINRATISDVNAEGEPGLICNNPVAACKLFVGCNWSIDDSNLVAMNLFIRQQRPICDADVAPDFVMNSLEPPQHFSLIIRDIDTRNSLDERMSANARCFQRSKLLDRKLVCHRRKSLAEG